MSFVKCQYSFKLLEEALKKEENNLSFWNKHSESNDIKTSKQAKGNIGACESRIKDLTEALESLKK